MANFTTTKRKATSFEELGLSDYSKTLKTADIITKSPVVDVRAFGAVGDGVTDDTVAIQAALNYAQEHNSHVFIPYGSYYITGNLSIKTSVISEGKFIIDNNSLNQIKIERTNTPEVINATTLTGLTKGSTNIGGLTNKRGTLQLVSTETAIKNIFQGLPNGLSYPKKDTVEILDDTGYILPSLDQTYTDTSKLTVTYYPYDNPIAISGLCVELTGDTANINRIGVVEVKRSNVTFYNLSLINTSATSQPMEGIKVENAINISFYNPVIKGIRSTINGYGISVYTSSYVRVYDGNITDCKHAISGKYNKKVYINGGFYQGSLSALFDSHWGNGFYINNVDGALENDAINHITFCGKDIEVTNSVFSGGLTLLGIRYDTPELDGNLIVRNIKWHTTGTPAYVVAYASTAIVVQEGKETTGYFDRTIINPALTILENIIINNTGVATVLQTTGRKYNQTHWGKIIIRNILANTSTNGLRAFVGEKDIDYLTDTYPTDLLIENINFPTRNKESIYIADNSSSADTTKGYKITVNNCVNFYLYASTNAFVSANINKTDVVNIYRTPASFNTTTVKISLTNCTLNGTNINGWNKFHFINCLFMGTITSSDLTMVNRVLSSFGNMATTDAEGRPRIETYGTTYPTSGTWVKGDIVYNSSPDAGEPELWECTVAGTPGTWQSSGQVGVLTSISSTPAFTGQTAVVSGVGYLAVGTSSINDWKQITNLP